jgi:microcystin-dependent protein
LLSIAQNTALFSVLGTTYGGDGKTNFALPDLRGRAAVNAGQGPGLSNYTLGEQTGHENVTLTNTQMPVHTHSVTPPASSNNADQNSPAGAVCATVHGGGDSGSHAKSYTKTAANATMAAMNTAPAGGGQPVPVVQPVLAVTFIIAVQGIYPSRN